ncbi:UDP-N-acetylmuramoyl-tripeptide--D-alanyl-D-alanine ligase [Oceanobacter mangrovi]|uniref:UDP-N-acetylmuramoyl-tripeptide--D-alanyl-D- alanine ligase n=1 Tax=Oceanobacter mangrovi TaxID=2862510 RepID=UPI001C8E1DA0|nr:UDP-N-acetylmuramoyl-tripeptide--D-alanyl-D-alanine ligase [Oceanobacter mangrovi]
MLFEFTLSQLAERLGLEAPELDARCRGVSTDTRHIQPGDLFVALKGEHFNGNLFAEQALRSGAAAVLLDEAPTEQLSGPWLLFGDTQSEGNIKSAQDAYGELAGWQREAFTGPLVAITGSAGKTTTKQLMASVLAQQFNTWMTQGNLNNHIGAPKTLLALSPVHQAAVVELGASGLGEIAYTAKWVKPRVGIITNAAAAHLEGFGSLQGVVQTKGELIDFVAADGTVVLNADDPAFAQWCERAGDKTVVSFGFADQADVRADDIELAVSGSRFTVSRRGEDWQQPITLAFPGKHNVANALAVFAAALAFGLLPEQIAAGLEAATAVSGRMKSLSGPRGMMLIDDSYNANPASIKAAIDVISLAPCAWLVLGDMAELGAEAGQAHGDIGRYAKQQGIDTLVATGPLSKLTVEAFGDQGYWLPARDDVAAFINQTAPDQTTVLVKGSRSAGMDEVVRLLQRFAGE